MKTTLTVLALLALLAVACGKDDDTTVAGVTHEPVVAVSTLVPTPQVTGTRLEIENISGTVGLNATAEIAMLEATEGLSGFKLEVSVKDPDIARIVGVDLSEFGLRDVGPLPDTVLTMTAVDLSRAFEGPFERMTVATLDLDLLAAGETEIILQVLLLDDDKGNAVSVEAFHGQLIVSNDGASP